jgi:imidazoleglycerol-phosphate dehydratase
MTRVASIERKTSESSVKLSLDLDGTGKSSISTSVPFFDHLLTAFSKHSMIDLTVESSGDTDIDIHHTVEDTAIVLGQAIKQALGDKNSISRFGDATVPLDEALVRAVVDLSGRPFLSHTGEPTGFEMHLIGGHFTGSMVRHVFEAICLNADMTVHINVLDGRDPHHIAETEFKAFARALRKAVEKDPRAVGIPSTKGTL